MPQPAHFLTMDCPAKVNLALSVASPLASGMHPIASWMVAVDFGDTLTLHRLPSEPPRHLDRDACCFSLAYAVDAPRRQAIDWPLEKDLAHRAHSLMEAKLSRRLPIKAAIEKRIPTGAGLGGGSSDAAAMMVGLNQLFALGLPADTLCQWSAELGSDIAFLIGAMTGRPSAVVAGLGDRLTPAPRVEPLHLALILPALACPTGAVYQAFDQQLAGRDKPADEHRVRDLAQSAGITHGQPFNDLADAACIVEPGLKEARASCESLLGQTVHVTGSGAAMFTLARDADHAQALAIAIQRDAGLPSLPTRTLG